MLAGLGCGKDKNDPTVIKGRITDQKTMLPIKEANLHIGAKKENANGNYEYFSPSCRSDADGRFNCTFLGNYESSDISKDGYVTKHNSLIVIDEQENNSNISLIPRDGFLRLRINNNTGSPSPLYATVYSRTIKIETRQNSYYTGESIKQYPLSIGLGETYTEILDLPSPEFVQIRWGFGQSTLVDSVMITPNDTTDYILSY